MFKKPPVLQSRTVLKSSVTRAVRQQIAEAFPALTPADLDTLIPPKSSITEDKLSSPSHTSLYFVQPQRPLFFTCPGAVATAAPIWLPTVYALWLCPHLLPALYIHPLTTRFILQGADLMLPGLLLPAPSEPLGGYAPFAQHDRVCVMARGNAAPFAVGTMAVGAEEVRRKGWTGRGVKVLHHWGDALWASGDKVVPNAGYEGGEGSRKVETVEMSEGEMRAMVQSGMEQARMRGDDMDEWQRLQEQIDSKYGNKQHTDSKTEEKASRGTQTAPGKEEKEEQPLSQQSEPALIGDAASGDTVEAPTSGEAAGGADGVTAAMRTVSVSDDKDDEEAAADESASVGQDEVETADSPSAARQTKDDSALSVDAMDRALLESLLYAIKLHLDDDAFPLTPSVLLSSYMERANPYPHRLDLKHSSYKQMAKFIKAMTKRGLLHTKQSRGDVVISGVHRQHPEVQQADAGLEYQSRLKAKTKAKVKAERERKKDDDDDEAEGGEGGGAGGKHLEAERRQLTIHQAYKPDAALREALWPDEPEASGLLSMHDAKQRLQEYIKQHELDKGSAVHLDPTLSGLLPASPASSTVSKVALNKALESHLALHHAISLTASSGRLRWAKGDAPPIVVSAERRQGSKWMTRVSGLARYGVDSGEFATEAQRLWASSATTTEDVASGKKGWRDVLIQGDVRDSVAEKLSELYQIPQRFVQVVAIKKPK